MTKKEPAHDNYSFAKRKKHYNQSMFLIHKKNRFIRVIRSDCT